MNKDSPFYALQKQIIRHGDVRRGRIGVSIQNVTPDIAQELDLPVHGGALITQVEKNSPAEEAGLQPGDAVIAIDGRAITDGNDVRNSVALRELDSKLKLTIIRKGETREITIRDGEPLVVEHPNEAAAIPQLSGAKITDIPHDHPMRGKIEGVYVAEVAVGSPVWRIGLRNRDIILAVNRKQIATIAEFEQAVKAADSVLALNILRGDAQLFIVLQ